MKNKKSEKSPMLLWAERECKIACKRENPDHKFLGRQFDYGCACYEAAYKVYKLMDKMGHSGASWSITTNIINDLLKGRPLSPITDKDFEEFKHIDSLSDSIQCSRYSSLFKRTDENGNVSYKDIDRVYYIDIEEPSNTWSGSTKVVDELFPIALPYMPPKTPYKIYVKKFLCDKKNGDWDTTGIYYIITPEGERVDVNKFMTVKDSKDVEITKEEFESLLETKRIDKLHNKISEHLIWTLLYNSSNDEESARRLEKWNNLPNETKKDFTDKLNKLCMFFEEEENFKYNTFSMHQALCTGKYESYKMCRELVEIADLLKNILHTISW